jgi:hypothetical protein
MLNPQLNARMCRVGPERPMGLALRRYWLPFLLASEVESGADPKGVELAGERFVAWRDDACADAVERGKDPLGVNCGVEWRSVAGTHGVLGERHWRELLPQTAEPEVA